MKNNYTVSKNTIIHSHVSTVFGVLADLENWNSWTKSVTSISFLENSRFQVGGKARVIQPKLSPAIWTITEIIENESFVWQTKHPGVKMIARHILKSTSQGTFVEHQVIYKGLLAGLAYKRTSDLTNQYLTIEINGLKSKCEKMKEGVNP
jgi:hypothetical protein